MVKTSSPMQARNLINLEWRSDDMKFKSICKAILVGALVVSTFPVMTEKVSMVQAASSVKKESIKYTTATVHLKERRHSKSKTLITVPKGKPVQYVKAYGSWSKVKYRGKTGYVPARKLSTSNAATKLGNPTQEAIIDKLKTNKLISYKYEPVSKNYYIYYIPEGKKWSLVSAVIMNDTKAPIGSISVHPTNRLGKPKDAEYEKDKTDFESVILTIAEAFYGKDSSDSKILFNLLTSKSEELIMNWEKEFEVTVENLKIGNQTFRCLMNDMDYIMISE